MKHDSNKENVKTLNNINEFFKLHMFPDSIFLFETSKTNMFSTFKETFL